MNKPELVCMLHAKINESMNGISLTTRIPANDATNEAITTDSNGSGSSGKPIMILMMAERTPAMTASQCTMVATMAADAEAEG